MAFGNLKIRLKSSGIKVMPIPNIIIAKDMGKNTLLISSVTAIQIIIY